MLKIDGFGAGGGITFSAVDAMAAATANDAVGFFLGGIAALSAVSSSSAAPSSSSSSSLCSTSSSRSPAS